MELKRAVELSLCSLLKEALPDLVFYSSRGGGDEATPDWKPSHLYSIGDVLRPTNHARVHAIVVSAAGVSGTSEPAFTDIVGSHYTTAGLAPTYETTASLAVSTEVDSSQPQPPFAVVSVDEAQKTMPQEETSYIKGMVVFVTRADSENVVQHSRDFKRIYDALAGIGSGYDILRRLTIHGVDISSTDEFSDTAKQAHGDLVNFTMGVTEKRAQLA